MSIESQQAKYMQDHYKWEEKVREIESQISQANSEGRNGKSIYEYQLNEAKRQARLCYELATDRGF
jgi:hypothetical protein